jgi:hypothetical protein
VNILVRNLSRKTQRFRIQWPSPRFHIACDMETGIATGLTKNLLLSYECKAPLDEGFSDGFAIISLSEPFKVEVPIFVSGPQPAFIYEPYINFGFVKTKKSSVEEIQFKNEGKIDGIVNLTLENNPHKYFKLIDESALLVPGEERKFRVMFSPLDYGIFHSTITVKPPSRLFSEIELTGTSIEFARFLVDEEDRELTQVAFPLVFTGQATRLSFTLVNNSPKATSWSSSIQRVGNKIAYPTPCERGHEETLRVLNCTPFEGSLKPYSKERITMFWKGKISE